MTEPWPYVRHCGEHGCNDVHRKWVEWGWFRVALEDARAGAAAKRAWRERQQRQTLERQHRERAAALARRRALGVQSMNLVW